MSRRGVSEANPVFDTNVFINCPFDEDFFSLLRPLLFTIVYLGFNPRIASERSDSAENRIDKICALIRESKYSVHDLSRLKARRRNEFYRMNMPFELGLDFGSRLFGTAPMDAKRCLVLEKERYEFMKALSDLSGIDVKNHANEPKRIVRAVRDWFVETVGLRDLQGPTIIWYLFTDFASDLYDSRKVEGFTDEDLNMMPVAEYIYFARRWVEENSTNPRLPSAESSSGGYLGQDCQDSGPSRSDKRE